MNEEPLILLAGTDDAVRKRSWGLGVADTLPTWPVWDAASDLPAETTMLEFGLDSDFQMVALGLPRGVDTASPRGVEISVWSFRDVLDGFEIGEVMSSLVTLDHERREVFLDSTADSPVGVADADLRDHLAATGTRAELVVGGRRVAATRHVYGTAAAFVSRDDTVRVAVLLPKGQTPPELIPVDWSVWGPALGDDVKREWHRAQWRPEPQRLSPIAEIFARQVSAFDTEDLPPNWPVWDALIDLSPAPVEKLHLVTDGRGMVDQIGLARGALDIIDYPGVMVVSYRPDIDVRAEVLNDLAHLGSCYDGRPEREWLAELQRRDLDTDEPSALTIAGVVVPAVKLSLGHGFQAGAVLATDPRYRVAVLGSCVAVPALATADWSLWADNVHAVAEVVTRSVLTHWQPQMRPWWDARPAAVIEQWWRSRPALLGDMPATAVALSALMEWDGFSAERAPTRG